MTILALRLAGPLQSWGAASRFVRRSTEPAPTKSGVLGLIAAAQGRRRTDAIEDLLALNFGVRIDQPGRVVRDFQTAVPDVGKPLPLSYRYYLGDAVFLALLEADRQLLEGIEDALRNPTFPLYLGRRSCPPVGPLSLGLRELNLSTALSTEPWQASPWYQRTHPTAASWLATVVDCKPTDEGSETVRDKPLSFDPRRREYGWRSVLRDHVSLIAESAALPAGFHDPMTAF
ncbi:MAG: type I-E CRISPR-associated protein Cas5/CasD [Actinomycetota bacterium]|nr:type I-E CRISPR-associated protein Cas5/CasD [Actinomycetota bacterium]